MSKKDCHSSCDVCFSEMGDKWPCAKAAKNNTPDSIGPVESAPTVERCVSPTGRVFYVIARKRPDGCTEYLRHVQKRWQRQANNATQWGSGGAAQQFLDQYNFQAALEERDFAGNLNEKPSRFEGFAPKNKRNTVDVPPVAKLWWLAVDKDNVVIFGGKDRTATNQYINDRMFEHPELLRLLYAYPVEADRARDAEQARMYRAIRHISTGASQDEIEQVRKMGEGFANPHEPTPNEYDAAVRTLANALNLKD